MTTREQLDVKVRRMNLVVSTSFLVVFAAVENGDNKNLERKEIRIFVMSNYHVYMAMGVTVRFLFHGSMKLYFIRLM